jgi:arylsulfatase A-like enzyme
MGLYGGAAPTPVLAGVGAGGALFTRAIAPSSWTAPSHAGMFTAQTPASLSVRWRQPLDLTYPTLAERMRARGYRTAGFVANTIGCTFERGLDRGFVEYRDYRVSWGELARSSSLIRAGLSFYRVRRALGFYQLLGRQHAPEVTADLLQWIDTRRAEPFFAFVNYFDAHDPYMPPPPFDTMFGPNPRGNPWMVKRWWDTSSYAPADILAEQRAYEGTIAYLDQQVGRLLDGLQQRGLRERTLIVITSDHGEEFVEHGRLGHGHTLFMELLHVPLLVSFPGLVPPGVVVDEPVGLTDLPATIEDLLGLPPAGFKGRSLARYWRTDRDRTVRPVLSWLEQRSLSIVDGPWHYVRGLRGAERLYRLTDDPTEQRDLGRLPEGRALLERLREAAEAAVRDDRASRPAPPPGGPR